MKPRRIFSAARLSFPLAAALVALLATPSAKAIDYYWDSDGVTAGFGVTTGTWGTSAFWSTVAAGTAATANTAITTSDTVNIGTTLNYGNAAIGVAAGGVSVNKRFSAPAKPPRSLWEPRPIQSPSAAPRRASRLATRRGPQSVPLSRARRV